MAPRSLFAAIAGVLLVGCASRADRQVDALLGAAREGRERPDPAFTARVLARPAWLDAAPVGVDDWHSRDPARALAREAETWRGAKEPADSDLVVAVEMRADLEELSRTVRVRGVRVSDVVALEVVLRAAGCALQASEERSGAEPEPPVLDVRVSASEAPLAGDVEVVVRAEHAGWLAALGIVARTAAWDAGDARSGTAVVAVREELDPTAATAGAIEVRVAAGALPQTREVAECIALGAAAMLAEPRAGDLGRYLYALDGAYQVGAEASGVDRGGLDPQRWHREARRALRRLCLHLEADDVALEPPVPLPAANASDD